MRESIQLNGLDSNLANASKLEARLAMLSDSKKERVANICEHRGVLLDNTAAPSTSFRTSTLDEELQGLDVDILSIFGMNSFEEEVLLGARTLLHENRIKCILITCK